MTPTECNRPAQARAPQTVLDNWGDFVPASEATPRHALRAVIAVLLVLAASAAMAPWPETLSRFLKF